MPAMAEQTYTFPQGDPPRLSMLALHFCFIIPIVNCSSTLKVFDLLTEVPLESKFGVCSRYVFYGFHTPGPFASCATLEISN